MLELQHRNSPSQGDMPKAWNDDNTVLYKYSVPVIPKLREMDSEWICCRLAKLFGIKCVNYTFHETDFILYNKKMHDKLIRCPSFLYENNVRVYRYLPANTFARTGDAKSAAQYVFQYDAGFFARMLIFDFLICNTDRHLNNFGLLQHINGGFTPAPLFDNDKALFSNTADDESGLFKEYDRYVRTKVGAYSLLEDGALDALKMKVIPYEQLLSSIVRMRTGLGNVLYDLPTDMSKIRRKNIALLVNTRLDVLERMADSVYNN